MAPKHTVNIPADGWYQTDPYVKPLTKDNYPDAAYERSGKGMTLSKVFPEGEQSPLSTDTIIDTIASNGFPNATQQTTYHEDGNITTDVTLEPK